MNVTDIVLQIIRMKGLMLEVNRTTVAVRFRTLITNAMKKAHGDDHEKTLQWINVESHNFMSACKLTAPRAPIGPRVVADESDLAKLIDKWESVNLWRVEEEDEWQEMSKETLSVKSTLLQDLRDIAHAK